MSFSWSFYACSIRVPEKTFYGMLLVQIHLEIEFEVYSLRTELGGYSICV